MNDELANASGTALDRLTELLAKLAGPAAEELGETMRDSLKVYRFKRQLRLMKRIDEMARAAGFNPKAVPLKLLFPALEQATIEQDDDLQDLWAALIANASDPRVQSPVQTYFVDILRQLTKAQALLLQAIFIHVISGKKTNVPKARKTDVPKIRPKWSIETHPASVMMNEKTLYDLYKTCVPEPQACPTVMWNNAGRLRSAFNSAERERFYESLLGNMELATDVDNLVRLGLLRNFVADVPRPDDTKHEFRLTSMGFRFVKSCNEPNPISTEAV